MKKEPLNLGDFVEEIHGARVSFWAIVVLFLADVFPSYYWQLLYSIPLFIVGGGLFLLLMNEAKTWQSRGFILMAYFLLVTGLGLDFIEGLYPQHSLIQTYTSLSHQNIVHLIKVVEEFVKMLGLTLLAGGSLFSLSETVPSISFFFVRELESRP